MDGSTWIAVPAPARRPSRLGWLIANLRRWHHRARERRMLADIGITRLDQARECEKPFWRA